jgi:hypothetical protein
LQINFIKKKKTLKLPLIGNPSLTYTKSGSITTLVTK